MLSVLIFQMEILLASALHWGKSGDDSILFVTVAALTSLPKNVTLKLKTSSDDNLGVQLLSPILTINLFKPSGDIISYSSEDPLKIEFPIAYSPDAVSKKSGTKEQPGCYYYDKEGNWTDEGCRVATWQLENSVISCECTHLTSFAALMRFVKDKPKPYSRVVRGITYVGNGGSIFSLVLGLGSFSILGWKNATHKERIFIHRQLMFALMIALMILLMTGSAESTPMLCKVVAMVLYHAFLSVFCWMLVEAIHLYRLIVIVYGSEKDLTLVYYAVGWGLPVVISAITIGIGYDKFGIEGSCWLSPEDGFVWAFLAPVLSIIAVNAVVLGIVTQKTMKASRMSSNKNIDIAKAGIRSSLLLLPMLGTGWVLGIAANWSQIMTYVFDIINSAQGIWLVLVTCYFNSEVRVAMGIEWNKRFGGKVSSQGPYSTNASLSSKSRTSEDLTKID